MVERLRFWLFEQGKGCGRCCLCREFYDTCRYDVMCQNRKRGKRMRNFRLDDESGNQEALFSWAEFNIDRMPELEFMHHVPNGGKRDRMTAISLKRQGVKAGVPDIFLPASRGGCHGLYIELKAGKNATTEKQKKWLNYLSDQGYYTAVCYGWRSAANLITTYLQRPGALGPTNQIHREEE